MHNLQLTDKELEYVCIVFGGEPCIMHQDEIDLLSESISCKLARLTKTTMPRAPLDKKLVWDAIFEVSRGS